MSDALLAEPYLRAIEGTAELLSKLRLLHAFVGTVARAAWLGGRVGRGADRRLALMNPAQKNQVAMMATNRGFRVEREEIEQSEELDLVPLNFVDPRRHPRACAAGEQRAVRQDGGCSSGGGDGRASAPRRRRRRIWR